MAVVGREADLAVGEEVVEPAAVRAVTETEQDLGRHAPRREAPAQQGQGRDADPAADQDRPGRGGRQLARLGEGVAERAVDPDPLPDLELT